MRSDREKAPIDQGGGTVEVRPFVVASNGCGVSNTLRWRSE
jgi:hypothetical protein